MENSVDIVEISKSAEILSRFFFLFDEELTVDSLFRQLPPFPSLEHFAILCYDTLS